MARCSQCTQQRARASATWFAGVSTALWVLLRYLFGMARWTSPPAQALAREILQDVFFFAWMYLWWRWAIHYRHLPPPHRTRYLLTRLGWFAVIALGLGALLILIMELLGLFWPT